MPLSASDKIQGAYAKVTTHNDGSRSFYEESADGSLVTQKNYSPGGKLNFITSFKFDESKNPRAGKVEDPKGKLLLKIRYAYNRNTGRLAKEAYFDMTKKRVNPKTNKIQPIQIVIHEYDSDGKPLKPKVLPLISKAELADILGVPIGNATLTRE